MSLADGVRYDDPMHYSDPMHYNQGPSPEEQIGHLIREIVELEGDIQQNPEAYLNGVKDDIMGELKDHVDGLEWLIRGANEEIKNWWNHFASGPHNDEFYGCAAEFTGEIGDYNNWDYTDRQNAHKDKYMPEDPERCALFFKEYGTINWDPLNEFYGLLVLQ